MRKATILIVGLDKQVGNAFYEIAEKYPQFHFMFTTSTELDTTKPLATRHFVEKHTPQYIINCTYYTAMETAETDVKGANKINVEAARNLAKAAQSVGAIYFQISTDHVYHNKQNTPFKETDPTTPKSVYAKSRLQGDLAALKACEQTLIIRTSSVYGFFGHNILNTMLKLGVEKSEINVVFDQFATPTFVHDLCAMMLTIIQKIENKEVSKEILRGVWHYANEGVTSWYDFAKAVFEMRHLDCKVIPIETAQFPTLSARPHLSILNKAKIRAAFGIEIPYWRDSLALCLKKAS